MTTKQDKPLRGFAAMDTKKRREIASKGGQNVPADKRSFSQNRALAVAAGIKGGQKSHASRSATQPRTTQEMIEASPRGPVRRRAKA